MNQLHEKNYKSVKIINLQDKIINKDKKTININVI